VQLRARSGQSVAPDEVRDAVLWFKPNRSLPAPKAGRYTIDTRNKRFEPRTLVVPVGSTVDFPNSDPVIHNVFSLAPGNEFDLGLYGQGESAEAVLRKPGIVMAFCNVHYSMFAALVVVDTPYTTQVNADGSFELTDLPAGSGVLNLWHPRAEAWVQSMVLPSPMPLKIELPIVKTLIPQHTNKTGGSYRPVR
jgi:plastocyanin